MSTPSSSSPLSGLWQPPTHVKNLYYGSGCVERQLLGCLPSEYSKVLIITGNSIATKTPIVKNLVAILQERHACTFSNIKQHGLSEGVEEASEIALMDESIDTVLSVGGGSPIDSAKTISYRVHEKRGHFLTHLTIPTTLSAAECTAAGGYTKPDGTKTGFGAAGMGINTIFYDPEYAKHTPARLWHATAMRAVDHAVESFYHPYASEMPWKALSGWALHTFVSLLPMSKQCHPNDKDVITQLQLAAFASSGLRGKNFKGGMGLSHSLGYALGSPYGIPHGETSCMTLGRVVKLKATRSQEDARQIARLLPALLGTPSGDSLKDALEVGDRILALVDSLGLSQSLSERGLDKGEVPIIAERALGGVKEGSLYEDVVQLVEDLY